MKKFSIALVAVLSLAAVSGCKKKKDEAGNAVPAAAAGDCAGAVAKGVELAAGEMSQMGLPADKMAEVKKLFTDTLLASCNEDKWPAEAIACVKEAKDSAGLDACDAKFGAQKAAMDKRMDAMKPKIMELLGAPGAGGDEKPTEDKPAGDTAAAGDTGSTGIAECDEYKAAIEKLASCDKLDATTKDTLKQSYDAMSAGWAAMKDAPAEAKAAAATGCKSGADAIMNTGKAVCGW